MGTLRVCCLYCVIYLLASAAWANDKPDFNDPEEVMSVMRTMIDGCSSAGATCSVPCGYGLKTIKNFLKANPQGDPSILEQRWQPCYDAFRGAGLQSAAPVVAAADATAGNTLDFNDHESVVASINEFKAQCGEDTACHRDCGIALKAMKNFNHPQPHYAGLRKSKWESCRDKVPGTQAPAAPPEKAVDLDRFVIAGVPLGGDMNVVEERLFLLKGEGYFSESNREYSELMLNRGQTAPGPDIIKFYEGTIREDTFTVFFEATGDGHIYKIDFAQREPLDIGQVTAALVERFGEPTKHQGNYLMWGCDKGPMNGFCVKANPGAQSLTIWAFDENTRQKGYAAYDKAVMQAKGIKSGAKF